MSLLKTPAITLKSRKWGDADRIVTFYTLRFGKVRGVARGARRMKSQFGSALEPFVHCDLNLFEKRNDPLYRVTQADIRESFVRLREDLDLMGAAARMVNLTAAVTGEGDPSPGLFETLLNGLRALGEPGDPSLIALLFQIRILGQTGFRPQTDHCAACGRSRADATSGTAIARFSPSSGGLVCELCARRDVDHCFPLMPGSLSFLQQAIRWSPAAVTRLKATGRIRDEVEAAIEAYVTVVAGRRLPPADFLAAEMPATYDTVTRPVSDGPPSKDA
jgi:DNA repair protein RecO (recombination protein O)